MNRSDLVTGIAYLEQMQAAIGARVEQMRAQIAADARAEYEEQGTAPTWRIADVATVTASVSRRAVVVDNEAVFATWVANRYPTEVETKVRPVWQRTFLTVAVADEDTVCDPKTGEVIPGLTVRRGGEFRNISVKVTPAAQDLLGELAGGTVRRMLADSDLPAVRALEAAEVPA